MANLCGSHGWQMSHSQLKVVLGFDGATKFAPEFTMGAQDIDGTQVYIKQSNHGADGKSRFGHRVYAICSCGKHVPAGRLHQHRKAHTD